MLPFDGLLQIVLSVCWFIENCTVPIVPKLDGFTFAFGNTYRRVRC